MVSLAAERDRRINPPGAARRNESASKAVTSNSDKAAVSATASALPTPYNWLCNARPTGHAAINPSAEPASQSRTA